MKIPTLLVELIASLLRLATAKKEPRVPRPDRQREIEREHERRRK